MIGTCGDCGKTVLIARNENAKNQRLNPDPDPEGNIAIWTDHMSNVRCRPLLKGQQPMGFEQVFMPHQATCAKPASKHNQRGQWTAPTDELAKRRNQRRRKTRPGNPRWRTT